jgi:hypothetical protein
MDLDCTKRHVFLSFRGAWHDNDHRRWATPTRPNAGAGMRKAARRAGAVEWALAVGVAAMAVAALLAGVALGAIGASTASAHVVQRQPAAGTCHMRGSGLLALPSARCTPGLRNPAVTQATIRRTICVSGWTATVRPPASITGPEKIASMRAYGLTGARSRYEYDHFLPLELGGAVNAAGNLWPEPDYASRQGFYLNPKDRLENVLRSRVCSGALALATAQRLIVTNWVTAYHRYVSAGATGSGGGGATAPGGYYTSSYPTAHLIYCADDPAWHGLSPRYLVHFPTLAAALRAYPGRHLHQSC